MRTIVVIIFFIFSISFSYAEEFVLYRFVNDITTLKVGDHLVIANPTTRKARGKVSYNEGMHNRDAIYSNFISDTELLVDTALLAEFVLEGKPNAWLLKDLKGYLTTNKEKKSGLFVKSSTTHSNSYQPYESYLSISLSKDKYHHDLIFNVKSPNWAPKQINYYPGYFSCYSLRESEVALFRRERVVDAIILDTLKTATYYYGTKTFALPEGLTAYTIHANNGVLVKGKIYKGNQVLPANQAVIIEGSEGVYILEEASTREEADPENLLRGSDVRQSIEATLPNEKLYKLSLGESKRASSLGFYWDNENGDKIDNHSHKAFLVLTQPSATTLHFISMPVTFSTNIKSIKMQPNSSVIYNLCGQKVLYPTSGIYIINNKKVYIK